MSGDGRQWLFRFPSICKKLDGDCRIQLHALRLKIQNFTLLLCTSIPTTLHCDPRAKTSCGAAETATPVRYFDRLRLPLAQDSGIVLGLDDGILDGLTPALAG